MKKRAITGGIIFLLTALAVLSKLLPFQIGTYVFDIFAVTVSLLGGFEIAGILEKSKKHVNLFLTTFYGVFNYAVILLVEKTMRIPYILTFEFLFLILYYLITLLVEYVIDRKQGIKSCANTSLNTIIGAIYPSFMFELIIIINHLDGFAGKNFSFIFIVLIFGIAMLTDTMAYLVGSLLRGPKLAPSISPNKTISGAIGGLFGGMFASMIMFIICYFVPSLHDLLVLYSLSWWQFLLIGFFGSVLGQIGDLFESKLKRIAGVKDSGDIFPGHGGMLDRVDAVIFITVFMYIVVVLIAL